VDDAKERERPEGCDTASVFVGCTDGSPRNLSNFFRSDRVSQRLQMGKISIIPHCSFQPPAQRAKASFVNVVGL